MSESRLAFAIVLLLWFAVGPVWAETAETASEGEESGDPAATGEVKATEHFPSLDDRELGEPLVDAAGQKVTYDRALPFLGQKVVNLGIDLPNPYGVSLTAVSIEQELLISDLEISIAGGPRTEIDFVQFDVATADNLSPQVRGDMWLLPFMIGLGGLWRFPGRRHRLGWVPLVTATGSLQR